MSRSSTAPDDFPQDALSCMHRMDGYSVDPFQRHATHHPPLDLNTFFVSVERLREPR
jgi:hypothetical protein